MALFPLGILSAAGAEVGGAYELIETAIVSGTSTSSILFSNLGTYSSTYKHLQIRVVARNVFTSNDRAEMDIRLNADSSNHNGHRLAGNGSAVFSSFISGEAVFGDFPFSASAGNEYGAAVIDIVDAFSTTKFKTLRSLGGHTAFSLSQIRMNSGLWRSTSALTSIEIRAGGANIYANSRFSIYGIKG
jgi:hypothetical protein